jgi:hypothetical protein
MEEIVVYSTVSQLEDFKESLIWKDIERELKAWQLGFEIEQRGLVEDVAENNLSTANVLTHLGDLHGRQKAIEYVLSIVDVLISIAIEEQEENQDGKE